jgi:hypothetical protein
MKNADIRLKAVEVDGLEILLVLQELAAPIPIPTILSVLHAQQP